MYNDQRRMNSFTVNLGQRSYPIYFVLDDMDRLAELLKNRFPKSRVFLVTNEAVSAIYRSKIEPILSLHGLDFRFIAIPDGEDHKNLVTADRIFYELIQNYADRQSVIVGFGGGVIGDIAGYAAASYMRGVPFVQMPTSLLAMVDSSVGGKVAVNHALGKNLIGAFYQPKVVFIDQVFLRTLPRREMICGFAEILKYGLILDNDFFEWAVINQKNILSLDKNSVEFAIRRSCELKSQVVEKDEKENDLRRILNFGHTWGHAFENLGSYRILKHGEAVLFGMLAAAQLSWVTYRLNDKNFEQIESGLLPFLHEIMSNREIKDLMTSLKWKDIWVKMQSDKKAQQQNLRWIALNRIGEAVVEESIPQEKAEKSFAYLQKLIQQHAEA
jgi:3-dehydroquinate synthase